MVKIANDQYFSHTWCWVYSWNCK